MVDNQTMEAQVENLSDAELLSAFLSKEIVDQLMTEYQNLYELVLHTSLAEISKIKGMGKAKAEKFSCIKELLYRLYTGKRKQMIEISSPKDIANYMRDIMHLKQEEFHIIMLNTKNKIIGRRMISKGTVSASLVSPREVFSPAVKIMASSLIVIHNHPSGEVTPSKEDIGVTDALVKAGELMGIHVLDHIIIGKGQYCNMREKGHIA